jgi:hypothetical protein
VFKLYFCDIRFKILPYKMKERRENLAAVTLDSDLFPMCKF